ncbi:putative G3BP-like protein [Iris pallida]|uniref:G3BP-like protein n=1 Tax=Iris pallida TaxID=29817 RepID=A0AAX6DG84_IRIPA|nr:putative G3BP-like protein [Iris pallida]
MAALLPGQPTAVQVGNYFVRQYYSFLHQQPAFIHQFYNDASTLLRLDGARIDSAVGMMQIHSLMMCLNYTVIELTTAHSLESWNGGVLVMVQGLLQTKESIARRKFAQTFFLAPQEKGYFVLNDILHFLEEELVHHHPAANLGNINYPTNIIASNPIPVPVVSNFTTEDGIHTREISAPLCMQETVIVEKCSFSEPPQQVLEAAGKLDETSADELTVSLANITNLVRERDLPTPAEAHVGEPTKHTYASILRDAKGGQPGQSVAHGVSLNKTVPLYSERHSAPQAAPQQSCSTSTLGPEKSEAVEESAALEDEGESLSVYVGNLHPSITISELEHEFKSFGRIRPDGVAIRSRKETGVFYAFVEFEDAIGVQNAIKSSPVQLNGRSLHVQGRRPNNGTSRGRRGGRGRGGYQSDASRGRFGGWTSGRGTYGQENVDMGYNNRDRRKGYFQRVSREDGGIKMGN